MKILFKIIAIILMAPFFIIGALAAFIYEATAFGFYCVDCAYHPDVWRVRELTAKLQGKKKP